MHCYVLLKKAILFLICVLLVFSFEGTYAVTATPVEFVSISAGSSFAVAIAKDGSLWSWGENCFGQLGDGTYIDRSTPKKITWISNVVKVECGENHVVALKSDGTVWTWGNNLCGQLGYTTTPKTSNKPSMVKGLNNITAVAGGSNHSLALTKDGTVWGWGDSTFGQLAADSYKEINSPIKIGGLTKIKSIASNFENSMAISSDGKVFAWGYGYDFGQIKVPQLKNVIQIATMRDETAFLLKDGTVWNLTYNLNNCEVNQIQNLSDITEISAGYSHFLALKKDGTVWKYGTYCSQDSTDESENPNASQVQGLNNINFIVCGNDFDFVINNKNKLISWGDNSHGQLGLSSILKGNKPQAITTLKDINHIISNVDYCVAIDKNGSLWEWGDTRQAGLLPITNKGLPTKKAGLPKIISAGCSNSDVLAYNSTGDLWIWGVNVESGDYTIEHHNIKQKNVKEAAGYSMNVFNILYNDGTVWRFNAFYSKEVLSKVTGLPQIVKLAQTDFGHNLAVAKDGTVWIWEYDNYDLIANSVKKISGLSNIITVYSGTDFSAALSKDGTVWTLGDNTYGQLGDGTNKKSDKPVKVKNLTNVSAIYAGGDHCLALKKDGSVWAWGSNEYGQLGDGTYINKSTPVKVLNLSKIKAIAAGYSHSFALDNTGKVYSWGTNDNGQLGLGRSPFVYQPTNVNVVETK